MSKLNRNTENQEHASHLPEHGPIDENGKEAVSYTHLALPTIA